MYTNGESLVKEALRFHIYKVINSVFPQGVPLRGLTLPALFPHLETSLMLDRKGSEFIAVEKDKDTYMKMHEQSYASGIRPFTKLHNMTTSAFFLENDLPFDFMWLDYCAPWSKAIQSDISHVFQGKTMGDNQEIQLVFITLAGRREQNFKQLKSYLLEDVDDNDKVRAYALWAFADAVTPDHLDSFPLFSIKYHDKVRNSKSTPMWLYAGILTRDMDVLSHLPPFQVTGLEYNNLYYSND